MSIIDQRARPHSLDPTKHTARVIHAVKNFAAIQGVCHIGLGVTATTNIKMLRRAGYFAEAWSVQTAKDLKDMIEKDEKKFVGIPPSHIIISAPSWVSPDEYKDLALTWPYIQFIQLNHSGNAFLSIDKYGIRNIRGVSELSLSLPNVEVAGNNMRFVTWMNRSIGPCLHLPNLYDTTSYVPFVHKEVGSTIRIGSFGAGRPWKNQLCAAEGALELAKNLGVNLALYINSERPDGGERMIEARKELLQDMPGATLHIIGWKLWPKFRKIVGNMHLLISPSFDETFNVITADGIAEGVPSVTASSIEWSPRRWWATPEDPSDIAKVGTYLLHDKYAVDDGRHALTKYANDGLDNWKHYLGR